MKLTVHQTDTTNQIVHLLKPIPAFLKNFDLSFQLFSMLKRSHRNSMLPILHFTNKVNSHSQHKFTFYCLSFCLFSFHTLFPRTSTVTRHFGMSEFTYSTRLYFLLFALQCTKLFVSNSIVCACYFLAKFVRFSFLDSIDF